MKPAANFAKPATSTSRTSAWDDLTTSRANLFGEATRRREPSLLFGRVLLEPVGYYIYYRVRPRLRRVEILALWHAQSGSGPPL